MGKRSPTPQQFAVVATALSQTATDDDEESLAFRLRLSVAVYNRVRPGKPLSRKIGCFDKPGELWRWIEQTGEQDRDLWVLGHDMGKTLRASGFFRELDSQRITLLPLDPSERKRLRSDPLVILEDPPIIVVCWQQGKRKLVVLDLLNYFRQPMQTLAESVGKPFTPIDYDSSTDQDVASNLVAQCEACEYTVRKLIAWVRSTGKTAMGYTGPGQSLLVWRTRYERHRIIREGEAWSSEFARRALYPGRVEIFNGGRCDDRVWHLDVKSQYPNLMLREQFPYRLKKIGRGNPGWLRLGWKEALPYIAEVDVYSPRAELPVRHKGKPRYFHGAFRTVLAGPELAVAVREGWIIDVHEWHLYDIGPLFAEFVQDMLDARAKAEQVGDKAFAEFAKLVANSLYGKLAERRAEWHLTEKPPHAPDWGFYPYYNVDEKKRILLRIIAGQAYVRGEKVWTKHAFPAISAFLTAYGRMEMYGFRRIAGRDNVYYQSTDSLFTNEIGHRRIRNLASSGNGGLGSIRTETVAKGFVATAFGCYRHGSKSVTSGIKLGSPPSGVNSWLVTDFDRLVQTLSDPQSIFVTGKCYEKTFAHKEG